MYNESILLIFLYFFFFFRFKKQSNKINVFLLLIYNFVFFVSCFGQCSWNIAINSFFVAPFLLLFIVNLHLVTLFFFRHDKRKAFVIGMIPPLFLGVYNFDVIIPIHPMVLLYQFEELVRFTPRFENAYFNFIALFLFSSGILIFNRKKCVFLFFVFVSFVSGGYSHDWVYDKYNVLLVQTGLFVKRGGDLTKIKDVIDSFKNVDIVIFSESPEFGFKEGSRVSLTKNLFKAYLQDKSNRLFILNMYGLVYGNVYNTNMSVFIQSGEWKIKSKEKLFPFWEKSGIKNKPATIDSNYFTNSTDIDIDSILYRGLKVSSNICYESLFLGVSEKSDLSLVQSNYIEFSDDYTKVVKNSNVMTYFASSSKKNPFIIVQNMGGSLYVDENGFFDWEVFRDSQENPIVQLNVKLKRPQNKDKGIIQDRGLSAIVESVYTLYQYLLNVILPSNSGHVAK